MIRGCLQIVAVVVILIVLFLIWKNLTVPKTVGLINGQLFPCPNSPNCVQSCLAGDAGHFIEPLPCKSDDCLSQIEQYVKTHEIVEVVKKTESYMHLVVTTPLCRYRDDLEFLVLKDRGIICVRSASRIGYGDGGVNRARIEKIRSFLLDGNI